MNKLQLLLLSLSIIILSSSVFAQFTHPGIYMSEAELDRMKEVVNSSEDSRMKLGYERMQTGKGPWTDVPKQAFGSLDYVPHPVPGSDNFELRHTFTHDGMAAEVQALMWVVTGDSRHAEKAIEIFNAWAKKKSPVDSLNWLTMGFRAPDWFSCADILKYYKGGYSGWSAEDIRAFDKNFTPAIKKLALSHDGHGLGNPYQCQNQNVLMARARMAIGVYDDDEDLFNNGLNLLQKKLYGGSAIEKLWNKKVTVFERTIAPNGEIMELNRSKTGDFDHANASLRGLVEAAEICWHQGRENLYEKRFEVWDKTQNKFVTETTPRLVKGLEYWSEGVMNSSFNTTKSGVVIPSSKTRYRKGYDCAVNHYKYRLGDKYNMPETEAYMDYIIEKKKYSGKWTATHANLSKDLITIVSSEQDKIDYKISIYPNPTSGIINVTGENMDKVTVFNMHGEIVKVYPSNHKKQLEINVENQPTGVYFIKISSGGNQVVKQIIKN